MELIHEIFYAVVCAEIFLCVQGQVTFNPDPEEDVQLLITPLAPPVNVTTVQCYSKAPIFRVQYVTLDGGTVIFTIAFGEHKFEIEGTPVIGSACGQSQSKYKVPLETLRFIADPALAGGTFKIKATLDNDEENSSLSKRTYTFPERITHSKLSSDPELAGGKFEFTASVNNDDGNSILCRRICTFQAPFNLTGSSVSAVLNSEFTWTCHVTPDYPVLEWVRDSSSLAQVGIQGGKCVTYGTDVSYNYECQPLEYAYTLTIPGPNVTEDLQGSNWRCKDVADELKGSKFMKLNIIVPVTNVTISPGGSGSTSYADENQTVTFTCTTNNANPAPTILWYNGSSDVTSQATGSNRTTLTLNVTRAEHQMSVRCTAWNIGNTANLSDSTTLSVRYPPANNEELQIMGYTSGQVLYENNPAMISINCRQPGGNPVVNMTFKCGSQTETNESTATEAIRRVNLTQDRNLNGQQCVCVSTHINGYMRNQSFSLIVYYPPSTPNISISSPFPWRANGSQSLKCNTALGNPTNTTYIWKEGETELSTTSQTYIINHLQSTDDGRNLSCQVNNNFTLQQNVELMSNVKTLQVEYPPANNEELQIMGYTSGQVLYENNPAMISINCRQPGGNPVVNMTFKCGSQTGTNESTATEAIRRVNLTNDRNLNGQQCVCVSTHINGYMRNQSFSLIVYYPPSTPNISISSPFPWRANGSQSLTCNTALGNPANTTYICKEGETELSTTSQTYIINHLQSTDNGRNLSCRVANNFTLQQNVELMSNVKTLQVEYPPRNNQNLQIIGYTNGQVLYEDGTLLGIYCKQPGGNPVANMTFICGSRSGTNGNTVTEAIRNITLTNNRSLDGTQCVCTSTHINDFMRSTSVNFTVYYPPSNPTISTSSSFPWKAKQNKSLIFNTTPGNPADISYIWREGESELPIVSKTFEFNPLQRNDDGRQLGCQINNNFTLHKNVVLKSNVTTLKVEYDPVVTLEQSSVELIEGRTAVLKCSATGNPSPTVTWYRGSAPLNGSNVSTSTYSIALTYSIININRTETGNYTCRATSSSKGSNALQPDEKNAYLRVLYPPTVILSLRNATENTDNHDIRCSAVGDPNNATFVIEQKMGSTSIRNITNFKQPHLGNVTLNIGQVSYQDMGSYTCLASNGIPDRRNHMVQSDSRFFNVITSARFEIEEYTVRSDIDTQAVVRIVFYRNPPATESDVVWTRYTGSSNETLGTSANVSLSLNDADVQQTFYGVDVTLRGQSAIMNITSFQSFYEGNYTLKIRSSHTDSAEVRIALIRSGPPDTPSDFQLLTRKVTSIVLTWNKGSDGGHPQTFVILFRVKTSEIYTMKQLEDTTMNRNITYEIKSLQPGTSYEFLLYSFNEKGNSTGHRNLEEKTLNAHEKSSLSSLNSGLVGGAAGGGVAVLVVVIVIIVVVMRRRHYHGKRNDSKGISNSKEMSAGTSRQDDYDDGEDGLKDNPLYGSGASGTSGTSGTNAVQGAGAAPENPSLYAEVVKPKRKYPAKVSEDPPPIYAEVNKSNKKGKGPLKPKKKSPTKGDEDPPPIYAEVNKPNKKGDKGKQKQQKAKGKIEGDVYENVGGFKEKETQFNDPAEKQESEGNEPRGYRNQDGLLYVDVKFDQPPPTGKPVIRGEERTGYAMIEFEEPPTSSTADDVKGAEGGI